MASRPKLSEAASLEQYRVALHNAKTQPAIASAMAELGYDSVVIAEGEGILNTTRAAYDLNKVEDDETVEARSAFNVKKEALHKTFILHRKKAKVVFRNDSVTASKLGITGSLPTAYINWIEANKKFYTTALADATIQGKLVRLKVSLEELTATSVSIGELETARSEYLREIGESQDATKAKDSAFATIDDWMQEFYAVARIALEDNPQLLEALGLLVRS